MTAPERPLVKIEPLCETCAATALRANEVAENDPWRVYLFVAQLLLFQQVSADPDFQRLTEDDPARFTPVLERYGCMAYAFPGLLDRVIAVLSHGIDHAAKVSQYREWDPDHVWPKPAVAPDA